MIAAGTGRNTREGVAGATLLNQERAQRKEDTP